MKQLLIIAALILLLYTPYSSGGPLADKIIPNDGPQDESEEEVSLVNNRHPRAAHNPLSFWPNATVYYYFTKEILTHSLKVNNIEKAMQFITDNTCVKFVKNEKAQNNVQLQIRNIPNDCWASYGYGPNPQIAVNDWCASMVDFQIRNLMHILGFLPTLARKDRDNYVNLDSSKFKVLAPNFKYIADKPETGHELQTPYEYGSVLHWAELAQIPFTTKDELYSNTVSTFKTTFMDMKMINLAYCKDTCKENAKLQCANGGYPNPNKCSVCNCPDGLGGESCNEKGAGAGPPFLEASKDLTSVYVGAIPPSGSNSTFSRTNFLIKAPKDAQIEFEVTSLNNNICKTGCQAGGIEAKIEDPSFAGFRVCCSNLVNRKFKTSNNQLVLQVFSRSLPVNLTFTYKIAENKQVSSEVQKPIAPVVESKPDPTKVAALLKCDDETWIEGQQGEEKLCFKAVVFSKMPTGFADGKAMCESKFGAFAAPFRGEMDRAAIKTVIGKTNFTKHADFWSGFYIGIRNHAATRSEPDNFLVERDQQPITYSTWTAGQPDKLDRGPLGWEQCVNVMLNDNFNWNDSPCNGFNDHLGGIVCAKKPLAKIVANVIDADESSKKPVALPMDVKTAATPADKKPALPPTNVKPAAASTEEKPAPTCEKPNPVAYPVEVKPAEPKTFAVPADQKPVASSIEVKPASPHVDQKPVKPSVEVKSGMPKDVIEKKKCEDDTWINAQQDQEHLCFKAIVFSTLPTSYDDGKAMCKSKLGAFAAPFRGENDRLAIRAAINKTSYKNTAGRWLGFFIGIRNVADTYAHPGNFQSELHNSRINYTTWSATNPDKARKPSGAWEQCVIVQVNDNLNWNDGICGLDKDHIGIICAKDAVFSSVMRIANGF